MVDVQQGGDRTPAVVSAAHSFWQEEVECVVQQVRRLLVVPLLEEEVIEVGALFSWSWSSSSPQGLVGVLVFRGSSGDMFTPHCF